MASQPSPRRSLASPRGPQAPLQEGKSRALFQAEVLHHVLGSGHQVPRPSLALGSPGTQKSALLKGPPPQSGVSFTLGRLRGSQTPRQEQSASVVALQCFTCREPSSLSSCVTITTCNANETMCQITVYSLETGDTTVTMSCASKCVPWDADSFGRVRPVLCCDTDLCNVDGAPSLGSPHGLALTLALISLLSLQL
ncbi:ly6/PLAUR domain-containing protein 2 isoform X3 [Rhinolophus ferrumequinum]|uniref:ly6/PLAUR domain-containing protein 2 isoform X3 n=1 Tax=Rhinolophus ferrumequinum TaxID=59479 RepID=UPI00140FDCD1|nr:ly6/PLAUR domain-containing protein 2 isoform X3 [Rhinolophus ferrumequinum]